MFDAFTVYRAGFTVCTVSPEFSYNKSDSKWAYITFAVQKNYWHNQSNINVILPKKSIANIKLGN